MITLLESWLTFNVLVACAMMGRAQWVRSQKMTARAEVQLQRRAIRASRMS